MAIQTADQPRASFIEMACSLRWNTPRSTTSISRIKRINPDQINGIIGSMATGDACRHQNGRQTICDGTEDYELETGSRNRKQYWWRRADWPECLRPDLEYGSGARRVRGRTGQGRLLLIDSAAVPIIH